MAGRSIRPRFLCLSQAHANGQKRLDEKRTFAGNETPHLKLRMTRVTLLIRLFLPEERRWEWAEWIEASAACPSLIIMTLCLSLSKQDAQIPHGLHFSGKKDFMDYFMVQDATFSHETIRWQNLKPSHGVSWRQWKCMPSIVPNILKTPLFSTNVGLWCLRTPLQVDY